MTAPEIALPGAWGQFLQREFIQGFELGPLGGTFSPSFNP
jgi:hypothetical protein